MKPVSSPRRKLLVKGIAIVGAFALVQLASADLAMAQATNQAFAPLQTVVQAVVDFITGPFGRLIAIIAVIGLGFLAFAGRLSWFTAGAVVLGIGLVFGAPAIVDQLISTVGN
ncbi:TrbC/VirB2 family protein [Rhizobium sp. BE258]|jgi:type IV secretion system protein VirB2|uniref:TrbC/VirB2 family protein n=1 Tax=Rhizobium sp. BE258 TaxID=2817722 RepID=UPI0028602C0C|nr:TrbC/VirB2 family protein [Rhizobium sp. BE258]MDR7145126.1 type IV secretion system protein VirB2 [Rhizobium sp. BE258]